MPKSNLYNWRGRREYINLYFIKRKKKLEFFLRISFLEKSSCTPDSIFRIILHTAQLMWVLVWFLLFLWFCFGYILWRILRSKTIGDLVVFFLYLKRVDFQSDFSCFCDSAPYLFSVEFLDLKLSEISLSFFFVSSGWIFNPISPVSMVPLRIQGLFIFTYYFGLVLSLLGES